ncbi:MAG TPA: hypothetical protein VMU42_14140, partial [Candidatus Sulfotelmatobacter sp.]|nr:hypothetical protein [Candidatus Sulfotelmatobacter sp.]
QITVYAAAVACGAEADGTWCRPQDFGTLALPTAMKKICRHVGSAFGAPLPAAQAAPELPLPPGMARRARF